MVKNTKGGNKSKKISRKIYNAGLIKEKTRLKNKEESCEMYANVIKMCGNGILNVMCNDGIVRICIIRNKFKGRNKSKNIINVNTKVLVGLRDWEILNSSKMQKTDLLEVYKYEQHYELEKDSGCNWSILLSEQEKNTEFVNKEQIEDIFDRSGIDTIDTSANFKCDTTLDDSNIDTNQITQDIDFDDI